METLLVAAVPILILLWRKFRKVRGVNVEFYRLPGGKTELKISVSARTNPQ